MYVHIHNYKLHIYLFRGAVYMLWVSCSASIFWTSTWGNAFWRVFRSSHHCRSCYGLTFWKLVVMSENCGSLSSSPRFSNVSLVISHMSSARHIPPGPGPGRAARRMQHTPFLIHPPPPPRQAALCRVCTTQRFTKLNVFNSSTSRQLGFPEPNLWPS